MYVIKRNRLTGNYKVAVSDAKRITVTDLLLGLYEIFIFEKTEDFVKKLDELDELESEVKFNAR